jgi:predicted transcriptional regulator
MSNNFRSTYDKVKRNICRLIVEGTKEVETGTLLMELKNYIRANDALYKQFTVYDNLIESFCDKSNVDEFMKGTLDYISDVSYKDITNANKLFAIQFKKHSIGESAKRGSKEQKLNVAIGQLIKWYTGDIEGCPLARSWNTVKEHLLSNSPKEGADSILKDNRKTSGLKFLSSGQVLKLAVKRFNDKYAGLTKEEKEYLSLVRSGESTDEFVSNLSKELSKMAQVIIESTEDNSLKVNLERALDEMPINLKETGGVAKYIVMKQRLEEISDGS